jgi:hypothetical protein
MTGGLSDGSVVLDQLKGFRSSTDVDDIVSGDTKADPAPDKAAQELDPARHFWPLRNQRFLCSLRKRQTDQFCAGK